VLPGSALDPGQEKRARSLRPALFAFRSIRSCRQLKLEAATVAAEAAAAAAAKPRSNRDRLRSSASSLTVIVRDATSRLFSFSIACWAPRWSHLHEREAAGRPVSRSITIDTDAPALPRQRGRAVVVHGKAQVTHIEFRFITYPFDSTD